MKICKDTKCTRPGQKLSLNEFPRDRRSDSGRYGYCKDCCRRRSRELRAARGAREYRRRELGIERKPLVLSPSMAFSQVYEAVNKGCRTREEIKWVTKLDYDSIGEALLELWEIKGLRIERLSSGKRLWVVSDQTYQADRKSLAA
jgi:hypothetical protein